MEDQTGQNEKRVMFEVEPQEPKPETDTTTTTTTTSSSSTTTTTASTTPQQSLDLKLTAFSEFEEYFGGEEHKNAHGLFHVDAPKYEPEDSARGTLDLVAVVDISGSMAGSKLKLCIETLKFLVNNLTATDRLSVVTYNSDVNVVFPLTKMIAEKKQSIIETIEKLTASKCTNLSGGLFEGMGIMNSRSEQATVSSVLLMTDGMANEGVKGPALVKMTQKLYGDNPGYTIYTFGYGSSHNEDLLKELSEVGNGMYYFIEGNEIIPESFADCLGGLLSVVAQNIKITIKAMLEDVTIEKIHTSQKIEIADDKKSATITLGDMQSEEKRDLLVSYTLPKHAPPSKNVDVDEVPKPEVGETVAPLSAELSYVNVITTEFGSETQVLRVRRPMVEDPSDKNERSPNVEVEKQVARVEVSEAITRAMGHARRGSFTAATHEIQTTVTRFQDTPHAYVQGLNSELMSCMDGFSSRSTWQTKGKYEATNMQQRHARQRTNRVYDEDEDNSSASEGEATVQYVSKSKKAFRKKATKAKKGKK